MEKCQSVFPIMFMRIIHKDINNLQNDRRYSSNDIKEKSKVNFEGKLPISQCFDGFFLSSSKLLNKKTINTTCVRNIILLIKMENYFTLVI